MATSGNTDIVVTSWDVLRFRWWIESQSIANNTTTLGWAMELIAGASGRISSSSPKDWSVTVNGNTYSGTNKIGISNNTTLTLASGTTAITHNSDGTKSFSYSFSQDFDIIFSGSSIGTKSGSGTGTLDTIPRASTPTVSSSSVDMGGKVTITTNRASANFTHDLAYSFAGGAYVTIANSVGASYDWTTPDLASSIPNTTSGTVTIRCITKNGSTTVGTKTVTMTLKVPATVVPTISAVAVSEATADLAAQFGAYIQNKSTLAVKITAAGAKGSAISNYKTVVQGTAYTGASITTDILSAVGSVDVVVTVTDSRGRTASKTVTITVLEYTLPTTAEFKAFRCDENASAKDDGIYLSLSYAYSVASCGGKNTADMVIEYKTEAGSTWTELATGSDLEGSGIRFFDSPTFSTDYQYNVRMTVTDWFGASTSYEVTLPTADVVLDISSDGKGLGIGKVSQRSGAAEFARTMYDKFDALIGNGLAAYTGSGDSAIDPDTTLEHLIVTNKNTPTTDFWYVMTLFYSTKSDTANRVQIALPYMPYMDCMVMYMRVCYDDFWQNWYGIPAKAGEDYDFDIWHVREWADGWVELTGTYEISNMACNIALGSWYRTAVFTPDWFPIMIENPVVTASYESDGYGALLWATTEATTDGPPSYYLIRPTSATIVSGKVRLRVSGRKVDLGV